MLDTLFGKKAVLTCPYCLKQIRIAKVETAKVLCPDCQSDIPLRYRHHFADAPPLFVPVIGWTQVGKTVFLQALTMVLETAAERLWPDFVASAATDATMRFVEDVRIATKSGKMPKPTQLGESEAYIMLMAKMQRWGGRTLVLRDWAGENFRQFHISDGQASFLEQARTVLMMFSLPDLAAAPERSLRDLPNSYIDTLMNRGVDLKRHTRNIIVVLSKADLIDDLPPAIAAYLRDDPFALALGITGDATPMDDLAMDAYMERMKRVSRAIEEWLLYSYEGARTLSRLAKLSHMKLVYTVVSSTGSNTAAGGGLIGQFQPRRVLDPFFWALEFNSVPSR